jgi:hypothetical protein
MFVVIPREASVVEVNAKLDALGLIGTIAAPIAAVLAAYRYPRRPS